MVEHISDPAAQRSSFRVVGRSIVRHDAIDKIRAATRYAIDARMPGMLQGKVYRSRIPCGRIKRLDVGPARAVSGVAAVMTAADVPNNVMELEVPGQNSDIAALKARSFVLADEVVRYQGEPLALIAAESEVLAERAADAIVVEYEENPVVFDPEAALMPGAPEVHSGCGNIIAERRIVRGNVDNALAGADLVVEHTFCTQAVDPLYLEVEAGLAWIDPHDVITVMVSTQVLEHYREIARALCVPDSKVRLICPYVGGGFGGKEDVTVEVFASLLAWRTRRPVKLVYSRQESLLVGKKRHPFIMRYRTGVMRDGHIVAQDVNYIADGGAYAALSPLVILQAVANATGPYRVPVCRVRGVAVYTNKVPSSAMRGFGAMQATFGYESQMDVVASALGMDPREFRHRNYLRRGDKLPIGQVMGTHVALPETLDVAWNRLGPRSAPSASHTRIGRGVASNLKSYGRNIWLADRSAAWVGFEADGSLAIRCGVPDVGGGQASSLCQIASEVLAVPLNRITIHIGDSALTPLAGTTTATRQLYMSGNAVLKACTVLKERLLGVAARLLECEHADLELRPDGVGHRTNESLRVALAELLRACGRLGVRVHEQAEFVAPQAQPGDIATQEYRMFPDVTFGTHAVEVEVDTETGAVRILKYVACHDVGRAINPRSVEGQIEGGVAQGIGYALLEEMVTDRGVNLSTTLMNYLVPTAPSVPDIQAVILESGEGLGPFGARGIGEPPIGPVAPAIANAIADALGVRLDRLPMTPQAILAALRSASRDPTMAGL